MNHPILDHTDLGTFRPFAIVEENRYGIGLNEHDMAHFRQAKNENKQWFEYHEILDNRTANISYFTCYNSNKNKHTPEKIKSIADFIIQDFIENILGYSKNSY